MKISKTDCLRTPKADGFYMPGEFEPYHPSIAYGAYLHG